MARRRLDQDIAANLGTLVNHCDKLLGTEPDYSRAHNGLQLANDGTVTRIAAAVDAHLGVIERAVESGADLLVVHHGLFWQAPIPMTGATYRKFALAIENNLAVYSSHLPLDRHLKLGNNALLAKALGLKKPQPFLAEFGEPTGFLFDTRLNRDALAEKVESAVQMTPHCLWHGPETVRKLGIATGGAGNNLAEAAAQGIDTFLTGEGSQHTFGMALELGVNVIYAGHYATETFGVRALAEHLGKQYKLPWAFIDIPTGL